MNNKKDEIRLELSEEAKRHIKQAKKEIKEEKTIPLSEVKKELEL